MIKKQVQKTHVGSFPLTFKETVDRERFILFDLQQNKCKSIFIILKNYSFVPKEKAKQTI